MQQAALTDIFNRKHWKGQSSWYWSLGFKSTKSIADLRNAEQMIPNYSAPESTAGKPAISALKSAGVQPRCEREICWGSMPWGTNRAELSPPQLCGWRAVRTAEIPATTHVPGPSSWRQEFAHGHLHDHPNTMITQRPGQTAHGQHGSPRPGQTAHGQHAPSSGYPCFMQVALRARCCFFGLGLCIWLLVSKYNWRYWFLDI